MTPAAKRAHQRRRAFRRGVQVERAALVEFLRRVVISPDGAARLVAQLVDCLERGQHEVLYPKHVTPIRRRRRRRNR